MTESPTMGQKPRHSQRRNQLRGNPWPGQWNRGTAVGLRKDRPFSLFLPKLSVACTLFPKTCSKDFPAMSPYMPSWRQS
ncbi:hypothetical protein VTI74DRAFT_5381 [Chaetomium olivicolor]